jgi:hypothetical protein
MTVWEIYAGVEMRRWERGGKAAARIVVIKADVGFA